MKKTNIIKIASLTLLLGSFVGLAGAFKGNSNVELFKESTELTEEFHDNAKALPLKNTPKKASGDVLSPKVGIQLSDVDNNGNRSIRFVAEISSLDVSASFVRTMYDESGENVFQAESTIDVTKAYSSIISGGEEIYPSEGYNYFIFYTLSNVPETYWFHVLDVKVVVNGEEENREANIEGVMGTDSNVLYSTGGSMPSSSGHPEAYSALSTAGYKTSSQLYQAKLKAGVDKTSIEKITIDKWAKDIPEGSYVAKKLGPVVQTQYVSSGAFGGCTALKEINLPDSEYFYYLYGSSFKGCTALEEFTFPKYVSNIGSSLLSGCTSLKTVYFNSEGVRSTSSASIGALENLYISKDVKFIAKDFFSSSIERVYYSGTKEEWNNFKAIAYTSTSSKGYAGLGTNAGITNSLVLCSDTQKADVVFHFEGASLEVDGVKYDDKYVLNDWEGLKVSNPGIPFAEGKRFGGWFADTKYETRLTDFGFVSAETTLEYFAEFEDEVKGMGVDNPIEIKVNEVSAPVTTTWAMPHVYFKFVPEKSDIYYFNEVCQEEGAFTRSGGWLFDESMKQLVSATSGKFSLSYLLTAGETYYLKAGSYASEIDGYGWSKGAVQIAISTKEGDSMYEAVLIKSEDIGKDILASKESTSIDSYFEFTPKEDDERFIRIEYFTIGGKNPTITVYNKEDGSIAYSYVTLNTNAYGRLVDYALEKDKAYVFEVEGGSGEYTFRLDKTPVGASKLKALDYTLGTEISPINFEEQGTVYKYSSYAYYSIYYKFVAQSTFDAKININTTSSSTRMYAKVFEDGEQSNITGLGTESSPLSNSNGVLLAKEISFVEGKEYIININVRGTSGSTPNNDTSFSIMPVVVNPDEGGDEIIESNSSLENPIEVTINRGVNYKSWGSLKANVPEYFIFTISYWDWISLDNFVAVKLYKEGDPNPVFESTNVDLIDLEDNYGGTFILEVISSKDIESFEPFYQE